jgi:Flp pilus assembly protein TadB
VKSLVGDLLDQARRLLRAELSLAKREVRDEVKKVTAGGGLVAAGGGIALLGVMTLVAFAVIALAYVVPLWASALIIAVALLAGGGLVVSMGLKRLKHFKGPEQTLETLKEDARWASNTMNAAKSQTPASA